MMPLFNRTDHVAERRALAGGSPVLANVAANYWTGWTRSALPPALEVHHPPVALLVTEAQVFVNHLSSNGKLGELILRFPMDMVEGVVIGPWDSAASYFEWRATTGFLHGATHRSATSGLVFILGDTERVLFKVAGAPIEAETRMASLLKFRPAPPPPTP